jgi:transposase
LTDVKQLCDDNIGRALDRLFDSDRGSLLTATVVAAARRFGIRFDELHNDSTTIKLCGQYKAARGRSVRGKRAPWITYGHSKDRRRDLKQLLFILTTSADGGIPVQFRCEDGNTNDSTTHLETWESLCKAAGRHDFLYVADCKLCSSHVMETIDGRGGRLVTVLPRSRSEDAYFREWIQTHTPKWETVWNRPNPRRKYGPRDIWRVYRDPIPSAEGWPIVWVFSSLLRLNQGRLRREHIERGIQEIEDLQAKLEGPRPRLKQQRDVEEKLDKILSRLKIRSYLRAWVFERKEERFRQERPGRPGPNTRYRKQIRKRFGVAYEIDEAAIAYDQNSDGAYPLLTNDRTLKPAQVLAAHKRQPAIEKRFEQAKTVHEIAPVLLKNEDRIDALFILYFLALLVQALIERQLRLGMEQDGTKELPLYPEERLCRYPTARRVFQLFSILERNTLLDTEGNVVQVFEPEFTDMQRQVLRLLGVPTSAYRLLK